MYCNNSNVSRAARGRGFMALWVMLAMGLGLMASPAEAAPFAYVTNATDNTVSVIDTASNMVVGTPIPVGNAPVGVAVTPDGIHVYVANSGSNTVSVIHTATNTVVTTVPVGTTPNAVAVTPDGAQVYVSNYGSNNVSVIATSTNSVVKTVVVGSSPRGVAVTPDGAHVYVANEGSLTVSVIATATNTVIATVALPRGANVALRGVAVSPDGIYAYVTYFTLKYVFPRPTYSDNLGVINTGTNTVVGGVSLLAQELINPRYIPQAVAVAPNEPIVYVTNYLSNYVWFNAANNGAHTIRVGTQPVSFAFTPDGAYAYVANNGSNTVSVIATTTETVVATVVVGANPYGVVIVTPPCVLVNTFNAKRTIPFGGVPNQGAFALDASFTLSSTAPAINPLTQVVKLQAGTFTTTIPAGSFKKQEDGSFAFAGVIGGARLKALIKPTGTLRYAFHAEARDTNLTGTTNPGPVTLAIGVGCGGSGTSGPAKIFP